MEKGDLIKKLEETSLPEIEIPSHKKKLKEVLLNKYFREKRSWEIFNILRKVVPVGAVAIILIVLILNNLISPKYTLAQAKEIAMRDPQIKELIERGAIVRDVKILNNKGYVLIQPSARAEMGAEIEIEEIKTDLKIGEEFLGALAEVDLKEKRVSRIEKVTPQFFPLAEGEEEKVKEIAKDNPEIQTIVPKEAEIKEIIPVPYFQLKLIKEENSIKVVPEQREEKRARIIYEFDKNQWEGEIDLIEEKVKEVKFLGETENNATFQE
ncbi:hypothetical protein KJA15_03720 [Patescibacteria group bacterium]|nr:hypothetical protein [Patescibacteria group bacterium]